MMLNALHCIAQSISHEDDDGDHYNIKHVMGLMTMLTVDDDGKSSKCVGFYHHCTPFGSSL